ncbi:RICIN domain-containing protein [Streptomyces anulatus]|uniref:RICIN domain-containing protein n=1 Tax=Streptomyces anulatus TaxID=1892 RepID=UPI001C278C8C|nr:RICIN domain-containing protein [Streptomyces anulatus]
MARIARTTLAAAVGLAALVSGATTAQAEPNTTYFRFQVEHSGKCLTVAGGSLADDVAAVQSTCAAGLDNQLFALKPVGQGQFQMQAKHSGRCLTTGADLDWKVRQRWCSTITTQRWRVMMVDVAKGLHQLRPGDELDYCLTVPDFSTVDGVQPGIGQCGDLSPQRWTVTAAAS